MCERKLINPCPRNVIPQKSLAYARDHFNFFGIYTFENIWIPYTWTRLTDYMRYRSLRGSLVESESPSASPPPVHHNKPGMLKREETRHASPDFMKLARVMTRKGLTYDQAKKVLMLIII